VIIDQLRISSELQKFGEMVENNTNGVPLNHTCSMIDMDNNQHMEASMTMALAAQKEDMKLLH
jgi:hypothetical protein